MIVQTIKFVENFNKISKIKRIVIFGEVNCHSFCTLTTKEKIVQDGGCVVKKYRKIIGY